MIPSIIWLQLGGAGDDYQMVTSALHKSICLGRNKQGSKKDVLSKLSPTKITMLPKIIKTMLAGQEENQRKTPFLIIFAH